jgi:hypothetical protein
VNILAKEFEIAEFTDAWEYDDDLGGPASAATLAARVQRDRRQQVLPTGVFEQKGSSTCIQIEITPKNATPEFTVSNEC